MHYILYTWLVFLPEKSLLNHSMVQTPCSYTLECIIIAPIYMQTAPVGIAYKKWSKKLRDQWSDMRSRF